MNLMISALIELVHLFFAFDHNNHAKWIRLFFKIWRPCQKDLGQNSKWDASLLTEVAIVLSIYLLIMHMSR